MKSKILKSLSSSILLLLFWGGCGYDHGIDPIPYRIRGTVVFFGGTPPWYVREARIAIAKKFPPEDLVTDLIYSDPLQFNRDTSRVEPDTLHYDLVVDAGTYPAAGVLWRRKGEPWDIANILGIYGIDLTRGSFTPKEIVITREHPVADSVNIEASWELTKRDAFIEGDITFKGQWPDDTEIVALAFFPIVPRAQLDFLSVKALDITVPRFRQAPYHYRTAVGSGEYKFIALFWKGKTTSIFDIRTVGFYRCPNDTLRPKPVTVGPGETLSGIDFEANLSSLPAGVSYVKDGGPCPSIP
ncbi:MAG: hypothetical protein ONB44_23385 [candidate division KSB1 bacterium]|nr:hypothetical protein [candidate division KSB1 bacterium]MDZ7305085.1 hypothetical protein [candidate division KSB1 bacterium]MDZ7313402.1 hypothetical protein [candidate division KSB1 bacterium]